MKLLDAYRFLREHPQNDGPQDGLGTPDLAFVANVVMTRQEHSHRRAYRMRRLVKLVKQGKAVRFAPFSFKLTVDREVWTWEQLDEV